MALASKEEAPEINITLLSLVLIFIPGIVCYGVITSLGEKKDRDNVTMFLQIFMYGISSYLLLYVAHYLFPNIFPSIENLAILNPPDIEKSPINPKTIIWASLFGLLQGIIITLNLNYQLLLKFFRFIRLTGRFGDEDVWTLLLNSTVTDDWVTIRHRDRELVYQGYVSGFSSGGEKRELLLINVRVFTSVDMNKVADIPFMYMSFKDDDVTLELQAKPDKSVERARSDPNGEAGDL